MGDDYLVKSGARDLLTNAVAELLAVRPRMPLSFLAAQLSDQCCVSQGCLSLPSPPNASYSFQASTHPIASNAQMLRASYASKSRFQDSMVKVFQAIGSSSPVVASKPAGDVGLSSSVLPTKTIASAIPGSTTTPFATRSGKAVGSGEHCQQPGKHQPVLRTGTTTLDRRDFVDLLECLCEDFPNGLQQRTLDAVRSPIQTPAASVIPQQQPPQLPEIVSFAEFQRGVEVCLLLEELLDVIEDLFRSLDKSETGEVKASVLLLALETAATQQQQSDSERNLLLMLKESMVSTAGASSPAGMRRDNPSASELFHDRALRISDVADSICHLVFHP